MHFEYHLSDIKNVGERIIKISSIIKALAEYILLLLKYIQIIFR